MKKRDFVSHDHTGLVFYKSPSSQKLSLLCFENLDFFVMHINPVNDKIDMFNNQKVF